MSISGFSSFLAGIGEGNVTLNVFHDGGSKKITFPPGGGVNNETKIELPIDANVQSATMRVSAEPSGSEYPNHVSIDVGENGVVEWKFDEIGGGAMGWQNSFKSGVNNTPMNFGQNNINTSLGVRLPKGVTIDSATIDIWAEEQDYLDKVIELNLPGGGLPGPWDDVHDYDPILVRYDNKLIDIYRTHSNKISNGTDGDLVVNWTTDGINWAKEFREVTKVPDGTWPWDNSRAHWWGMDMRPVTAIYDDGNGTRLYVAWESNSTKTGPFPPGVTVDPDDSRGVTSGYDKDIIITSSSDGITWSDNVNDFLEITPPDVEDGNTSGKNGYNKANPLPQDWLPQLAVFKDRLYCLWVTNTTEKGPQEFGGSDIMVTWTDSPTTQTGWNNVSRVVNLTPNDTWNGSDFNPKLVVFQNKLIAMWMTNDTSRGNGTDYDILLRYTEDGDTWSSTTYQMSPKGQNDWTEEKIKGELDLEFWDMTPDPIVFDSKLWIAWETENWRYTSNRTTSQTDADIAIAYSTDGITWDLEAGVNTFEITRPKNDWGDHYPHLTTFDPDGTGSQPERLYVAWNSNDESPLISDYDIMYSYSTDGMTWEPQRFGSPHPDNEGGDYWASLEYFKGWLYLTWWSFDDKDGDVSGLYADGDDADVLVRRIIPSYLPVPDVAVDFNNDGTTDWGPNTLDTSMQNINIASYLTKGLTSGTPYTDEFGNEYVDITIKVTQGTTPGKPIVPCRIWLANLDVTYKTDSFQFFEDTADFAKALNDYIDTHLDTKDAEDGLLEIPIKVTCKSGGTISLSHLDIEYNQKPTIKITSPGDSLGYAKETFLITWEAEDKDDIADIKLYYDTDNVPGGEIEINTSAAPLKEGVDTQFTWTTKGLGLGNEFYIKAVISDGIDSFSTYSSNKVRISKDNIPPTITITKPSSANALTEFSYWIEWIDADEDSNAWISLYYDTNDDPSDGKTLIVDGIRENDNTNKYHWIIGEGIGLGKYYIYAEISDEENTTSDVSDGYIQTIAPSLNSPVDIGIVNNLNKTGEKLETHDIMPELFWKNSPLNPIPDSTNLIDYSYIINIGSDGSSDNILKNWETSDTSVKLANNLSYGGVYFIEIRVTDGRGHYSPYAMSAFYIVNNAPFPPGVTITPNHPTTDSVLTVAIETDSVDPDGDIVDYRYQWFKNEDIQEKYNGLLIIDPADTKKGDIWKVKVTPYDVIDGIQRDAGTPTFVSVAIENAAPKPRIVAPSSNMKFKSGETIKFIGEGQDPDIEDLDLLKYKWTYEKSDGNVIPIGLGDEVTSSSLPVGFQTIILNVTDGNTYGTTSVKIEILREKASTGGTQDKEVLTRTQKMIIGVVVAVIIVVIIVVALMMVIRRKKAAAEAPMYPELDQAPVEELPSGPSADELYGEDMPGGEGAKPEITAPPEQPMMPPAGPPAEETPKALGPGPEPEATPGPEPAAESEADTESTE